MSFQHYNDPVIQKSNAPVIQQSKPKVLILGKLPPPHYGPAIATEILLKSNLRTYYALYHLDTGTHESLLTFGQWSWKNFFKNIGLYVRFVFLILRHWPDLILIPISQATLPLMKDSIFILLSRLFCRRTVLQLRGSNFKNLLNAMWPLTRFYISLILRRTQGVIVLGNKLRFLFEEYFSPGQIFVVPNGANYHFTPPEKNGRVPRVLHLTNLQSSKGIEDVIEAARILKNDSETRFHLDVVGAWRDEKTRSKCLKIANDHRLPITFYPPADANEKFKFLAHADIFVFTPRAPEGHPWVIVEALAAGLPVISTDQGAIAESVIDGVNGFIVATQNPRQLAEKITVLLDNPDLKKQMGLASGRLYMENFTEDKMVQRLRICFDTLLHKNENVNITK